jgi:Protein of unknown function (DUF3570)
MLLSRRLALLSLYVALAIVGSCQTDRRPVTKRVAADLAPAMDETRSSGKAGHGTLEFRLGYYNNEDGPGDGNPFLNEELTVIEPVLYYNYNTTDETAWWTKLSYDNVTSASIERLQKYPNSERTGASTDNYFGVDIGRKTQSSNSVHNDVWVHGSAEYDYKSFGLGGSVSWDSPDRNHTTKVSGNFFYDIVDIYRFNGKEEASENRLSGTFGLTRYQVVNDRTHAEFGTTVTYQDGFLSTPYNAVVLEDPTLAPNPQLFNNARGMEINEVLPGTRIRVAVHGRIRRQFGPTTALELGGRVYADDWGIASLTVEPKVYQWLVRDKLRGRFRYRYYTQTAADDFEESFTVANDSNRKFRTQDSDLGAFDSHTFGFGLNWNYGENFTYFLATDYVIRGDGIDQLFASVGLTWNF